MRMATLGVARVTRFGCLAVSASAASAVPAIDTQQASNIVQVAGGCGRVGSPQSLGRCVPTDTAGRSRGTPITAAWILWRRIPVPALSLLVRVLSPDPAVWDEKTPSGFSLDGVFVSNGRMT
jgi:hypothetical protein